MRPLYKLLEIAKPFLCKANHMEGARYICYALEEAYEADLITKEENDYAWVAVRMEVHKIHPASYLIAAAKAAGLVHEDCTSRSARYVEFRDKWLQQLINADRAKAEQHPDYRR